MSQTKRAVVLTFPLPAAPPAPAAALQFDSDVLDGELDPDTLSELHSLELYREQVRLTEQVTLDQAIAFSLQEEALQKLLRQEEDFGSDDEAFELVSLPSELEEYPVAKCSCCLEPVQDQAEHRVMPCAHLYCLVCISTRCRMGIRDRSLVPAHCCKKEFPVDYVKEVLSVQEVQVYERYLKEKEWRLLDLQSDREYSSVVKDIGGVQCPGCGIGVQRIIGCNRMMCTNKHEFCFKCGKKWKTCNCDYWH